MLYLTSKPQPSAVNPNLYGAHRPPEELSDLGIGHALDLFEQERSTVFFR